MPKLALVTTADVKPSPSMGNYANYVQNIKFVHIHAEFYKETLPGVKNVWHFRFENDITRWR